MSRCTVQIFPILPEIHVVGAVGIRAVLGVFLIGHLVAVLTLELDALHGVKIRCFVVENHIAELSVEFDKPTNEKALWKLSPPLAPI